MRLKSWSLCEYNPGVQARVVRDYGVANKPSKPCQTCITQDRSLSAMLASPVSRLDALNFRWQIASQEMVRLESFTINKGFNLV